MTRGRKEDEGKLMLSLISATFIRGLGRVLTFGAEKYGARDWEQGVDYDRYFSALQRHLWDWWGGEKCDKETGISHLYHAASCIMFLATYEEKGMGSKLDQREEQDQGDLFVGLPPKWPVVGVPPKDPVIWPPEDSINDYESSTKQTPPIMVERSDFMKFGRKI
jgi:hypothetical protein